MQTPERSGSISSQTQHHAESQITAADAGNLDNLLLLIKDRSGVPAPGICCRFHQT